MFGGSGFYSLLDDVREVKVDTPYGPPSDSVFLAEVGGRRVAFLPRHGRRHTIPPHKINYRANVWAMRSLGRQGGHLAVRRGLAPAARQARRLRRVRPVRRPHAAAGSTRSTTARSSPTSRRPRSTTRSCASSRSPRSATTASRSTNAARSCHPGPALLDQVRVEVVQRRRLGGHQHDPVPRGVAVPRARDGRRQHQPDHRLRRRRPRGHRGGQRDERARGLPAERRADPGGRARPDRALPGRPRRARGAAPRSSRRAATATRWRRRTSGCSRRGCDRFELDPAVDEPPRVAPADRRRLRTIRAEPRWWLESARRLDAAGYAGVWAGTTSWAGRPDRPGRRVLDDPGDGRRRRRERVDRRRRSCST